ncbi:unnamed protein product [Discula destructiva]
MSYRLSSSPFTSPVRPSRDGGKRASEGQGTQSNPISFDDDDEDCSVPDSSPRSSPYFTQPTQVTNRPTLGSNAVSNTGTQPTQITNRPVIGLGSARTDASPSVPSPRNIEVPRSSPFKSSPPSQHAAQPQRQRALGGILALAPAGTSFKRPNFKSASTAAVPKDTTVLKRRLSASSDELNSSSRIHIRSDTSSSPDRQVPADIQRSSFQPRPQHASVPLNMALAREFEEKYDEATKLKARKLSKRFNSRDKSTKHLAHFARAIKVKKGDMDAAFDMMVKNSAYVPIAPPTAPARSSPQPEPKRGRLISKAHLATAPVSSKRALGSRSPSPVPVKRRRLVTKGNLNNSSNGHSDAPLISLVDSDDDAKVDVSNDKSDGDDYSSESESEAEASDTESKTTSRLPRKDDAPLVGAKRMNRILQYLDSCSVEDLAGNAKISKDDAKYLLAKRPFPSVTQLKAVHKFKTSGRRRTKVDLGEDVFDNLNQYVKRLDIIDRIIGHCDAQGNILKSKMAGWKMDQLGNMKTTITATMTNVLPYPKEPKLVENTLYPYQLFGMNWMWQLYSRGIGGILADDMGLGKTCQTIAFLALLVDNHKSGVLVKKPAPNLVIVPSSVLDNWSNEFDKFAPELSVLMYSGKPEERDELAMEIIESSDQEYDVILTSYGQMGRARDINWMNKIGINAAVFDEGHKLKNPQTKIYKEFIRINAQWKLLITGTPIQNNIMEMMSLLSFVSPQFFTHNQEVIEELFSQKASMKEVSEGATLLNDRIQRAKSILEPFILQRKKDQVLSMLPPKIRKVVYCDMLPQQKVQYEVTSARARKEMLRERSGGKKALKKKEEGGRKNDENNTWLQLRKAAVHPMLFRTFFTDKTCEEMAKILMERVGPEELQQASLLHLTEELKNCSDFQLHLWCRDYKCVRKFDCREGAEFESGKIEKLFELLEEYKKNGDRVLVFSRFAAVLEILQECLSKNGIRYLDLTGGTDVSERQALVDEFQQDESIPVFLLTTLAGGQGINLTAANKVIIFDQSDNPQHDVQAENRAHRMGQERAVDIVRLITKGTIDELVYKACQKKLELAGQITGFNEDIGDKEDVDLVAQVTEQFLSGEGGGLAGDCYVTPPKSDL